jgi:ketosteroid isomerase-like protein
MERNGLHAHVDGLYDAYRRKDFERVASYIHPDIDWVIHAPLSVFPFAGPRHGREVVLQAMADIAKVFSLDTYKVEVVIAEGDRAAVLSDVGFIQVATKRLLRFRVANFLRFQDAQLIEFREFTDSFDVVEQALGRELPI